MYVINFKIYLQSSSKAMTERRGGDEVKSEIWYLDNEKKVLVDEIKSISHYYKLIINKGLSFVE